MQMTFKFAPTFRKLLGFDRGDGFKLMPANPGASDYTGGGAYFGSLTTAFVDYSGMCAYNNSGWGSSVKKSSDGKTIYWYLTNTKSQTSYPPGYIFNATNNVYFWIAVMI